MTGAPVVPRVTKVLGSLEHIKARVDRQIAEYDALPEDHPNRDRLRSSHDFNQSNAPALGWAIACVEYHWREVTREAHASLLLSQLVEAVRATTAARTPETKAEAAGLLEEAMQAAGPWVDDHGDEP